MPAGRRDSGSGRKLTSAPSRAGRANQAPRLRTYAHRADSSGRRNTSVVEVLDGPVEEAGA